MLLQGASDLDQRCLKTRSSKDGCTFPQNIFAPAQNHPKPPFWGPFNAKPITERGLCKSHVNGATKLKFYIIVLGVCQFFFARGYPGGARPTNVNLGPPTISETIRARKLKLKMQLHVVKYSLRVQKFFR